MTTTDNPSQTAESESIDEALQRANASALPLERVLRSLSERLGAVADARAIFGAPVTHGEVTVIPVARAVGGFGLGGGANVDMAERGRVTPGLGAGAGFATVPVGFIEIRNGRAQFRRLDDSGIAGWLFGGVIGSLVMRALGRLLPFRKK
jgi:uncharacterized spore protein YtfJ